MRFTRTHLATLMNPWPLSLTEVHMKRNTESLALSIREFCEVVGIGRSTAYLEIRDNKLATVKCRGRRLIRMNEVTRYMEALTESSGHAFPREA